MKARRVEDILKHQGLEKGTAYLLSYLVERNNAQQKAIGELEHMMSKMIDTIANVVDGAGAMKAQMQKALKKTGLAEPDDDLDESTENIQ